MGFKRSGQNLAKMYLTAVTYEVAVIDSVVILQGTQRKGLMNTEQYTKKTVIHLQVRQKLIALS